MGTLFLVATPIGNLSDLTLRALDTLKSVDIIAAEDTRVSRKLLTHFDVHTPLLSYHEHNAKQVGEKLVERLKAGENVALITDAGTPAISDPGEDLVRLCIAENVPVVPVPGAVAGICALIVSGFSTRRFVFEGFLPTDKKECESVLFSLNRETRTAVLYEAPHRLLQTLSTLLDALGGERKIALCRELTKLNEEVWRGTLAGAVEHFSSHAPRGEFVLVLEGVETKGESWENLTVEEHYEAYLKQGYSKKDAIRAVASDRGVKKNEIYMHFVEKDT